MVWVLDEALAVVSEVAVADAAAVVGSDVAVAVDGSGRETWGCRVCRGAVGRLGGVCRRFGGVGSWFGAGEGVVVVVNDDDGVVDGADGGCVGVVNDDAAGDGGVDGCVGVVCALESVVARVVGSISIPLLISALLCFLSHSSRSAVLPRSSPSFSPFS